jgi:methyl-accepting chemotaxis protein
MQPDGSAKYQRKRLIVLRPLQARIIKAVTLIPLTALAFSVALVALAWREVMNEVAQLDLELESFRFLLLAFTALIAVATFVILLQALVFSNRIAGPIYRLHKVLEAVRAGDLSARAALRDHDLLHETAAELNETLTVLERRQAAERVKEVDAVTTGV